MFSAWCLPQRAKYLDVSNELCLLSNHLRVSNANFCVVLCARARDMLTMARRDTSGVTSLTSGIPHHVIYVGMDVVCRACGWPDEVNILYTGQQACIAHLCTGVCHQLVMLSIFDIVSQQSPWLHCQNNTHDNRVCLTHFRIKRQFHIDLIDLHIKLLYFWLPFRFSSLTISIKIDVTDDNYNWFETIHNKMIKF